MSAAMIILNAARNNRERWEQEEKERKKKEEEEAKQMIANGYHREYVLQNPSFRYHHTYRNIPKQNYGTLIISVSIGVLASIVTTVIVLGSLNIYLSIPVIISLITWMIGDNKFRNETTDWSADQKAPEKPGHYHLYTEDKARHGYEWVKNKKK